MHRKKRGSIKVAVKKKEFKSIIPEELRWRNWAVGNGDGEALTGDALLEFVNARLFPTLKALPVNEDTPRGKTIVKEIFSDLNQYMKNGILLRQVVNVIDEIDFSDVEDRHTFGDIYEGILCPRRNYLYQVSFPDIELSGRISA